MSQDFEWEMAVAIARNTGDVSMIAKLWRHRGGPEDIFAADVIEGRFKRLRQRPATREAMVEMFRRWHLVETFKSQGHGLKAAVGSCRRGIKMQRKCRSWRDKSHPASTSKQQRNR